MSTGGSGKKRMRGDLVVMSMNVAGVDPDEFVRAFKKIKPDIVVTQEHPASNNHALNVKLRSAITTLNADKATNTEVQYDFPELTREFWQGGLMMTDNKNKPFVCHANTSGVKQYGFIYNRQKFKLRRKTALVNHTRDAKRKADMRKVKDSTAASDLGFGARPPVYAELERTSDKKRVGLFNYHAPPQSDLSHDVAMNHFEECDPLATSKTSNHMTIIAGDLNDVLGSHMLDFTEGVDRKFDHIISHNADSHEDLQTEHGDVLDNLGTKIEDHFAMACEFKFK